MTRMEWRKPRRFTNLKASVQTRLPTMSQTTMSCRSAPATGTVKNTTLPSQSAIGASHALIVWSTVMAQLSFRCCEVWHGEDAFRANYCSIATDHQTIFATLLAKGALTRAC